MLKVYYGIITRYLFLLIPFQTSPEAELIQCPLFSQAAAQYVFQRMYFPLVYRESAVVQFIQEDCEIHQYLSDFEDF